MSFRVDTPPRGTDELVPNERLRALKAAIEARKLPVRERFEELVQHIVRQIESGQKVVVFEGETGSGKSVYGPAAVREALRRTGCLEKIVVMEPRKDAAVGVATATAAIQETYLGGEVGYATSEGSQHSHETLTHVVTSGIAIRYLLSGKADRDKVGAVIIDEVHERTIETDLALGQLKRMREEGRAPLVVLMSATADHTRLARHFSLDEAASIKIEGRAYPVKISHTEEQEGESSEGERRDYLQRTVQAALKELMDLESDGGDILAFLPGEPEIHDCIDRLRSASGFPADEVDIFGLYGLMKPGDRQHVLQGRKEGGRRRVIFATNIAESSVTVPGVTTVIDTGRMRIVRFDEKDGIKKREDVWISKESAVQRAGRAGRESPGKCIRLYSERQFERMDQHPTPSILLEKPSRLVLQLRCYGVDELTFPYYEAPNEEKLRQAHDELTLLGLIDRDGNVTEIGRRVERLPFEPRIGMLLLECEKRRCFEAGLILAAASRETRIFAPPSREQQGLGRRDAQREMRQLHEKEGMIIPSSDWFTTLEVFNRAIDEGVFYASTVTSKPSHHQTPAERLAVQKFYDWANELRLNPHALLHIAKRIKDYASDYYRLEDEEFAQGDRRRFHVEDFCRALEEDDGRNDPGDISIAIGLSHKDRLYYCDGSVFYPLDGPETSARPVTHPGSATFSLGGDRRPFVAVATVELKDDPRTFYKKAWAKQIHKLPLAVLQEVVPDRLRTRAERQNHPWNSTSITTTYTEIVGSNGPQILETQVNTEKDSEDPRSWAEKCVAASQEFFPKVRSILLQNRELADFVLNDVLEKDTILRAVYDGRRAEFTADLAMPIAAIRNADILVITPKELKDWMLRLNPRYEETSPKLKAVRVLENMEAWRRGEKTMSLEEVRTSLLAILAVLSSSDVLDRAQVLTSDVAHGFQQILRSSADKQAELGKADVEEVLDLMLASFERGKRFYEDVKPRLVKRLNEWDMFVEEKVENVSKAQRLCEQIRALSQRIRAEPVRRIGNISSLRISSLPDYEQGFAYLEALIRRETGLDLDAAEDPQNKIGAVGTKQEKKKGSKYEGWTMERRFQLEARHTQALLTFLVRVSNALHDSTREDVRAKLADLSRIVLDLQNARQAHLESWRHKDRSPSQDESLVEKMRMLRVDATNAFKKRQKTLFSGVTQDVLTELIACVGTLEETLPASEAQAFIAAGEIQREAFEQKIYEQVADAAIACLKTRSAFAVDTNQLITETLNSWS